MARGGANINMKQLVQFLVPLFVYLSGNNECSSLLSIGFFVHSFCPLCGWKVAILAGKYDPRKGLDRQRCVSLAEVQMQQVPKTITANQHAGKHGQTANKDPVTITCHTNTGTPHRHLAPHVVPSTPESTLGLCPLFPHLHLVPQMSRACPLSADTSLINPA